MTCRSRVKVERAALRVVVADDGVGHADPQGRGLQGLADRVSALRRLPSG